MLREQFKQGIAHVGQALRDPDEFAVRYHRGEAAYRWWVWGALWATAVLGTTTYGMTMGMHGGAATVLAAVGIAMIDVFGRVFRKLEPHRGTAPVWWLALMTAIGTELFYFFGLFDFSISG